VTVDIATPRSSPEPGNCCCSCLRTLRRNAWSLAAQVGRWPSPAPAATRRCRWGWPPRHRRRSRAAAYRLLVSGTTSRNILGCITKLKLIAVLCVGRSYIELTLQPCLLSPVVLAAGSETAGCDYSVHTPLHPPASTRVRPPKVPPCQVPRLAAARAVPSALPQTFSIIHAHPSL
jgi:hypothetical protein